jgi:hypothetical protein
MVRHKSWRFKSLLTVTPDLAQCIHDIHRSEDAFKRILSSQILNGSRPDHLVNVEVRFARSDLNHGCSELPLEGYVQSKLKLDEYIKYCQHARRGSPVGGRCNCSDAYRSFRAPHPDYIRLSLYGEAALNKGGRPKKLKEVPLPSFLTKIASHPTKHLASASYKIHMLRPTYFTLGGIFS